MTPDQGPTKSLVLRSPPLQACGLHLPARARPATSRFLALRTIKPRSRTAGLREKIRTRQSSTLDPGLTLLDLIPPDWTPTRQPWLTPMPLSRPECRCAGHRRLVRSQHPVPVPQGLTAQRCCRSAICWADDMKFCNCLARVGWALSTRRPTGNLTVSSR